jgi:hypothetical protein
VAITNAQKVAVVAPQVAKDLEVIGPAGLAMDSSGNSYLVASITTATPISLDGHSVESDGNSNLFLAAYGSNGLNTWAVGSIGDTTDAVFGVGAAVTNDGTLAAIGNFTGTFSIDGVADNANCTTAGGTCLSSASPIDFLAAFNASSGAGKWAEQFNDGSNGKLAVVAANPSSTENRIAVCGFANTTAPTNFVGSTATAVNENSIIIGAFSSTGTKLWASQYINSAGTGVATPNCDCDAIAVDDNGDVFAAGTFTGATLTFGSLPALTGPDTANRKFVWVAKFSGATGTPLFAASFNGTGGSPAPTSLAVDASDNVVVVGGFTAGTTTLTSDGGSDAFIAKLNGSLEPQWANRLGGTAADTANGVAVDSSGEVYAVGLFNKTATVSGTTQTLTTSTTTSSNPFLLQMNGATGAIDDVVGYPDSATSAASAIAVNRWGTVSPNLIGIAGEYQTTITFPAPAGALTSVGTTDVWFVTAKLQ